MKPRAGGSGPTKSTCTCWNRPAGMAMKDVGVLVWRWTLLVWQATQVFVQLRMSLSMLGQKNLSFTKRRVAFTPGWAMPWS